MRLLGYVGVFVVVMAAACGTESARPEAPSEHTAAPPAAASAEKGAEAGTSVPMASGAAQPASEPQPAAGTAAAGADKPAQEEAKPSAPVYVTAALRPGAADLDVVFGSDGTGVTIKVWGVDRLNITKGATPISMGSVKSGQSVKIAVQYDTPAAEANLAVGVTGTFGGHEQKKVQSFTISPGSPPTKASAAPVKLDSAGRPVKVLKAQ
jgi:hypothetical protein